MRILKTACLAALLSAAASRVEAAPAGGSSLEAGVDHASVYLFRGVDLLDGESVIVPRAIWTRGGLALSYFGYYGDLATGGHYGEADFSADQTFELGKASLTLGALTYQFNGDAERELAFFDTYEVYGILTIDLPLSPTFTYYQDVDKVKGGYGSFGLSHEFALGERVGLNLSGSAGWDFHYNNADTAKGTFNDVLFTVQVPVKITEHFSISGQVQRSIAQKSLDERVKADPESKGVYGDQTVVTAGAAFSF